MKTSILLAAIGLAVVAAGPSEARSGRVAHRHAFTRQSVVPVPYGYAVEPQYNDPGPPLAMPQPGNPVEQLAPLQSTTPGFWMR
jgi:hypothetical protein